MKNIFKELTLFLIGGFIYILIEVIYRGYSHWTMFILGGVCFVLIGAINNYISWDMPIWKQMLIGSFIITSLEFVCGFIVNMILKWNIWDYSDIPFNLFGQICLPFSILWFFISFLAIFLDDYIRYIFWDEEFPHYKIK